MHQKFSPTWRPEIDGLRALAIVPVILYHLDERLMPGGYLGVDLFFVISGFLITSIILRDLDAGKFSIARFYERRARRILPALLTVVATTMVFGAIFLFPWEIEKLAEGALSTLAFVANFFYLGQIDYFDGGTHTHPLIHMWSLSVEEQYYLLLPPVMLYLWSKGARVRALFWMSLAISVASFAHGLQDHAAHASRVFYIATYRAWEIGMGTIAAIALRHFGRPGRPVSVLLSTIGIILIGWAMWVVHPGTMNPTAKLPTVLGAVLVLVSAANNGPAFRLLSMGPVRFIGLISFSLYLWHQPVLSYWNILVGKPDLAGGGALLLIIVTLAYLTWRFIETPLRSYPMPTKITLRVAGDALAATAIPAFLLIAFASEISPVAEKNADLSTSIAERGAYVRSGYNDHQDLLFNDPQKLHVLIIGDSFSQDLYNMLNENGAFKKVDVATHYIKAKCQPYFGPEDPNQFVEPLYRFSCDHGERSMPVQPLIDGADLIFIAANWRPWSAQRIDKVYDHFKALTSAPVVLVGSKSLGVNETYSLHQFARVNPDQRKDIVTELSPYFAQVQKDLHDNIGERPFIDLATLACEGLSGSCHPFTPEGKLKSADTAHLTQAGAAYIGQRLISDPVYRDAMEKAETMRLKRQTAQ